MCIGSYADISVHAPTRGATSNSLSFSIFSVFQSTLPREERLLGLNFKEANSIFQSTLPREERLSNVDFKSIPYISIHAPTRGATATSGALSSAVFTFQSTLPREERRCCCSGCSFCCYFNPRSHERSDVKIVVVHFCIRISIHAPTRGATAILHKKFVYFYTIPTINI